jgi:hypothetical protein
LELVGGILRKFSNAADYDLHQQGLNRPPIARFVRSNRKMRSLDLGYLLVALALFAFPIGTVLPEIPYVAGGSVSIAARLFVAAVAVLLLVSRGASGKLAFPNLWLFIFLLAYSIRLVVDYGYGDRPDDALLAMQFLVLTVIVPVAAISCIRKQDWDEKRFLRVMLIFGTVFFALALFQFSQGNFQALGGYAADDLDTVGARLGFERMNPIILGHTASTVLIACVAGFLGGSKRMRVISSILAVFSIYFIIMASSRGPIVSLAGVFAYLLFVSGRGWWLALIAGFVVFLASLLSFFDLSALLDSTRLTEAGKDINSIVRFEYQAEAFESFLTSPILGSRFDLPISGSWPHNILVEVLMATGVVGGFVFAFALGGSLMRSINLSREQINMGSLILIQSFIGLQFSGSIWGGAGLWMSIAMVNAGLGAAPKATRLLRQMNPVLR